MQRTGHVATRSNMQVLGGEQGLGGEQHDLSPRHSAHEVEVKVPMVAVPVTEYLVQSAWSALARGEV